MLHLILEQSGQPAFGHLPAVDSVPIRVDRAGQENFGLGPEVLAAAGAIRHRHRGPVQGRGHVGAGLGQLHRPPGFVLCPGRLRHGRWYRLHLPICVQARLGREHRPVRARSRARTTTTTTTTMTWRRRLPREAGRAPVSLFDAIAAARPCAYRRLPRTQASEASRKGQTKLTHNLRRRRPRGRRTLHHRRRLLRRPLGLLLLDGLLELVRST